MNTILHLLRITLAMLLFPLCSNGQRSYDFSFDLEDYEITSDVGLTSVTTALPDYVYCHDTSLPQVPSFPIRILVHEDSTSLTLQVDYEKTLVATGVTMKSNPASVTTDGEEMESLPYATNSVNDPVTNCGVVNYGNIRYAYLKVSPFLYDADTHNLYFVESLSITLPDFPATSYKSWSGNPTKMGVPSDLELLNPNDFATLYPVDTTLQPYQAPVDYLVITSDTLAGSFEDLMEWKTRKGLYTRVVTTDSIYMNYKGDDCQEQIKRCISEYVNVHGVKWVLLGGDDAVVPTRYCKYNKGNEVNGDNVAKTTPSDIYYACLYGTFNWDANANGIYGEMLDGIDFNPSVYISRLPIRTTEDVASYTTKLMKYERDIPDHVAVNRIFLTGYNKMNYSPKTAEYYNERIFNEFIEPYWDGATYYMYENSHLLPDNTHYNISANNLKSELNRGYNLIHECSHGEASAWRLGNEKFTTSHAGSLKNNHPSVIVTNSCMTNAYDEEVCLSEEFIRNPSGGAIAYFGSSREGWGGKYDYLDESYLYDGYFFKNLFLGYPQDAPYSFAAVASLAKMQMIEEAIAGESPDRWLQFTINPVGEPEMQIHTDAPKSLFRLVGHKELPPLVMTDYNSITVSSYVDSCKFVLVDEAGLIRVIENQSSATFSGLEEGVYKLSVFKHNYVPYLTSVNLCYSIYNPFQLYVHKTCNSILDVNVTPTVEMEQIEAGNGKSAITGMQSGKWNITISNSMTGENRLNKATDDPNIEVDTSTWPSGIYVVKATTGNTTLSEKINIQ